MTKILVVDDLAVFREPIEAVLRADGHEVLTAGNGLEALSAVAEHRPDLVLLDLDMPVMDGITALRRLRSEPASRATKVVVLSAKDDRGRVVEAVKLGISGYILKAEFSLKTMLDRVRGALATEPAPTPARLNTTVGAPGETATKTSQTPQKSSSLPEGSAPATKPASLVQRVSRKSSPAGTNSLTPIMTRAELLEQVAKEGELTGFSPTVAQVLKITASPTCSMEQVAKAVGQDHAVALKILRLANSAAYSRGDRVDNVLKAVLRIGIASIHQAVLNIGVVERFGSVEFDERLNMPMFWEHSIACGLINAQLAHELRHRAPDAAFTAGLLHDLGRVIFAERIGESYLNVLDAAAAFHLPLEVAESRLIQMTHAEVMDRILSAWKFHKDLIAPITLHHHAPDDARKRAPSQINDVLRLGLADRLAHAMLLGCSGNETIYPTEMHCRLLGVGPQLVRIIEDSARQQTDDTKFALLSHSNSQAWPRCVDRLRARLRSPIRPAYITASPDTDAYRIFVQSLAGTLVMEDPNVIVVHLAEASEADPLTGHVAEVSKRAGDRDLPILTLSPGGTICLGDTVTKSHRVTNLPTPTPILHFIEALNMSVGAENRKAAA